MTLEQYIKDRPWFGKHIDDFRFATLYVRRSKRYPNTVEIASIEAWNPGEGSFTALLRELNEVHGVSVFIESVLNERFAEHLIKIGFEQVNNLQNYFRK